MPRPSQSNQDLQKSQVGICRPKNSFFQSKHSTPKPSHHQTILPYSPSRQSYPANFALNIPRGTNMPETLKTLIQNSAATVSRAQNRSSRPPLKMNPTRSRRTWKGKTFLFVTLLRGVWEPGPVLRDSRAGRRAPGSPPADTPPLGPRARPPARPPRPRALTCSRSRILGAAPGSAARLPGSRGAAAAAAPARQPAPRRAHGARAPHFLSPNPRPADHSPGQSPAAATGKARRWDRPARRAAQRNRAGVGAARGRTDGRARDARPEQQSGRGRASLPPEPGGRAGGSGEAAAARDLRELECGWRGAGEVRTAAPGRRGGGAPLLFLII